MRSYLVFFFTLLYIFIYQGCNSDVDREVVIEQQKNEQNKREKEEDVKGKKEEDVKLVANSDNFIVSDNNSTTLDILKNDYFDIGLDELTIRYISTPIYGKLSIKDNKVIYTPNKNIDTKDSFMYKISNGNLESNTAIVTISNYLLNIINDKNGDSISSNEMVEFFPHNNYGIKTSFWAQAIAYIDGYYLMSKNVYEKDIKTGKNEEKYLLFNLFDKYGVSIGNVQVDYGSHGQDLSIEKIDKNRYYIYTRSLSGKGIVRFILDLSNIGFKDIAYNDQKLDIVFDKEIQFSSDIAYLTPALNEEKTEFVGVGYDKNDKDSLVVQILDKESEESKKIFKFSIAKEPNGYYNQGIAMKNGKIFVLRGHWDNKKDSEHFIKKLYVLDDQSANVIAIYSIILENYDKYYRTEPEGLVIIDNILYGVFIIKKDKALEGNIELFKLLDLSKN
jgi:hypothetical protein